jgi:quinol monooxygenase YgiN
MNPITVIAQFKARPGQEMALGRELLSLVEPSRKDAGCLNYDLHQGTDDPGSFLFHENWATRAHLDAHLAKPDLQATLARVGKVAAAPPQVSLWERIV